jgi:hypothetical protein
VLLMTVKCNEATYDSCMNWITPAGLRHCNADRQSEAIPVRCFNRIGGVELHRSAMDDAEHSALCFRPARRLIQSDAVDAGNGVVVDAAECRDQRWYVDCAAGVLIPPGCARVEAQDVSSKIGEDKLAGRKIFLGCRAARVGGVVPNRDGVLNPQQLSITARGTGMKQQRVSDLTKKLTAPEEYRSHFLGAARKYRVDAVFDDDEALQISRAVWGNLRGTSPNELDHRRLAMPASPVSLRNLAKIVLRLATEGVF